MNAFPARFEPAFAAALRATLGLADALDDDLPLALDLLGRMAADEVDYTLFFRRLKLGARAGARRVHRAARSR